MGGGCCRAALGGWLPKRPPAAFPHPPPPRPRAGSAERPRSRESRDGRIPPPAGPPPAPPARHLRPLLPGDPAPPTHPCMLPVPGLSQAAALVIAGLPPPPGTPPPGTAAHPLVHAACPPRGPHSHPVPGPRISQQGPPHVRPSLPPPRGCPLRPGHPESILHPTTPLVAHEAFRGWIFWVLSPPPPQIVAEPHG